MSLQILQSSPMHSIQDAGRFGLAHHGITPAGFMDRSAAQWANRLAGNPLDRGLIEIVDGGLMVQFEADAIASITGAWGDFQLNGAPLSGWGSFGVRSGDQLKLGRLSAGRFTYLTIAGGFDLAPVLGSVATSRRDGLGGLDGRGVGLQSGDHLMFSGAESIQPTYAPRSKVPSYRTSLVCQVMLSAASVDDSITQRAFTVAPEQSRMGYRLIADRPLVIPAQRYSIPLGLGAIQVPPNGHPIVLMRDHQTLGGYPVIGYVLEASLNQLAQRRPGQIVHFQMAQR